MKRRLTLFAERFNSDDSLKKFLPYAQELGLLPSGPLATLDPGDVAKLLKATPGLDKAQVRGAVGVDCGNNDTAFRLVFFVFVDCLLSRYLKQF